MCPINILHIMTRLPVGGVENQLLSLLRNYDKSKLSPLVCSLSDKGQIGEEIERDDQRGVEDRNAHHQRVVAVERALHEVAADAGQAEDLLDNQRSADDVRDRRSEITDER